MVLVSILEWGYTIDFVQTKLRRSPLKPLCGIKIQAEHCWLQLLPKKYHIRLLEFIIINWLFTEQYEIKVYLLLIYQLDTYENLFTSSFTNKINRKFIYKYIYVHIYHNKFTNSLQNLFTSWFTRFSENLWKSLFALIYQQIDEVYL